MQKFNGSLIRQFPSLTTGNAAAGVQVSVYISGTNTFATLYATNNVAGAQLSNPLPTDDKGFYAFFAADGRYRLEFNNGFPALEEQLVDVIDINAEVEGAIDAITLTAPFDFNTGGTVTARNQVVLWSTANGGDGREYRWAGALPKTVPPASTPASTGGISDSAWVYTANLSLTQRLIDGTAQIGNVTAAQVSEASDIAIGNFVTPEQFFTGDVNDPNADWLSACNSAVATGRRVLLSRMYGLSNALSIPSGSKVSGISRDSTGFFRLAATIGANTRVVLATDKVHLSNFKVDANNIGGAFRCNGLQLNGAGWHVESVDAYNCTGYGHYTEGVELAADAVGVYIDCYAENCQISFEQIGALDVSLYRCRSKGNLGRTASHFHPYAGSKKVSYKDCYGEGDGVGIDMTVTNGLALGPFTFDNVRILKNDGQVTVLAQGLTSERVDATFIGGSYINTGGGPSVSWQTSGNVFAYNTEFNGGQGFNCAATANNIVELTSCQVRASGNNPTGPIIAMVTNSAKVKMIGGELTATNSGAGGAVATNGTIEYHAGVKITPALSIPVFQPLGEIGGVTSLSPDGTNEGFFTRSLPVTPASEDKVIVTLSILNTSDTYLAGNVRMSWRLIDSVNVRVRVKGDNPVSALKIAFRMSVIP